MDGQVMRFFLANIPRFVALFAKDDLGSDKLEEPMKKLDGELDILSDFIRVGILAELKANEFMTQTKRFMNRSLQSKFITEAMMWKLRDVYLRYGFERFQEAEFRRIIAEADADLQGLKGEQRTKRIAEVLQEVRQRRLVAAFKS